jgi:hypothetical protein
MLQSPSVCQASRLARDASADLQWVARVGRVVVMSGLQARAEVGVIALDEDVDV